MRLDVAYHLSPVDNRGPILHDGLSIMQPVSDELTQPDGTPVAFPWVCLAPSPMDAWALLPQSVRRAVERWDVWQVQLVDTDRVEVRTDLGVRVREVRAIHGIGPDRVHYIGTYDPSVAKPTTRRRAARVEPEPPEDDDEDHEDDAPPRSPAPPRSEQSSDFLLTTDELADELRVPKQTIYHWRKQGGGPPALRIGRGLRYRRGDVDEWLASQVDDGA